MVVHSSPIMAAFSPARSLHDQRALILDETEDVQAAEDVPAADHINFSDSEEPIASGEGPGKRKLHNVLTVEQRVTIVKWMIKTVEPDGDARIEIKAVKKFPQFLRGSKCENCLSIPPLEKKLLILNRMELFLSEVQGSISLDAVTRYVLKST